MVIEILSRLPIELVAEMKCVCKWWSHLITSHQFRNAHFRNSHKAVSGIFIQGMGHCVGCKDIHDRTSVEFIAIGKEGKNIVKKDALDFLPEKVVVTASCNGLLICRSLFQWKESRHEFIILTRNPPDGELVIYVCNPLTREFSALKPNLTNKERCGIGLAFSAFSTSFEVVVVQVLQEANNSFHYIFKIYSSKTDTWRVSKEVCYYSHQLVFQRHFYVNGTFYWLTEGHSFLSFDLNKEKSHITSLPNPVVTWGGHSGVCSGESGGYIHYVSCTRNEFRVWILNHEYSKPKWESKYFRYIIGTSIVESWDGYVAKPYSVPNMYVVPYAFKDDVVFMDWDHTLCGYNIKTGNVEELCSFCHLEASTRCEPIFLPYTKSLLPVRNT